MVVLVVLVVAVVGPGVLVDDEVEEVDVELLVVLEVLLLVLVVDGVVVLGDGTTQRQASPGSGEVSHVWPGGQSPLQTGGLWLRSRPHGVSSVMQVHGASGSSCPQR
jgi:hypothetical protein